MEKTLGIGRSMSPTMVVVSNKNKKDSNADNLNLRRIEPAAEFTNNGTSNNLRRNLVLSLTDSYQVVDLQELLYCESDGGYTTFYLTTGKRYMVSKPLKSYEERLEVSYFTRPHQSFMVNLRFIDKVDKSGTIHLVNGTEIPVSSRKKEEFLTTFLNYHGL